MISYANGDALANTYEASLSNSHKNKEGVYYTPNEIVQRFFETLPDDCSELTFCDPCCGTGNFLLAALKHGFKQENVYGIDIDPTAVEIAKQRVFEYSGNMPRNILCEDFLGHNNLPRVDIIFTNPPWGKKLSTQCKNVLSARFQTGRSKDTSAIFLFVCIDRLNLDGYLGMLLQSAFFNIAAFEDARRLVLSLDIKYLIDFGAPFKGVLTKAKGLILRKRTAKVGGLVCCELHKGKHVRIQQSFNKNPKLIINFACTQEEAVVIERLISLPHTTLLNNVVYGLGIVTGNNKRFCIPNKKEGYIPVTRGADITKDNVRKASIYIPNDLSLYQQVAPDELYNAGEKLIYRFISSTLVFFLDTEQRFLLNSANMLVVKQEFPISSQQACDLLNSRIINWFFNAVFDTHKILRSDIESIPIYVEYFAAHSQFSEVTFLEFAGIEHCENGTFVVSSLL